jgi:DNA-binding IclR family transcriptional regulator
MHKGKSLLTVQAAGKSLELLESLIVNGEQLRITELAVRLGVSRKEALLFLVMLESRAMVLWDDQARLYRPGIKTIELVRQFLTQPSVRLLEPVLRTVKARTAGVKKLRPERSIVSAGAL